MRKAAKWIPWAYGLLVATLLFVFLNSVSYFRYENSDDILIVKAFMGFEGGVPATFQLYQHTFLSYFLGWISNLPPGIPWFSLLQLGALWLSIAIISGSLFAFLSNKLCTCARLLFSLLFAAIFATFAFARINFTTTAAMLGAAAVALLASTIGKTTIPTDSLLFSIGLLLCSYMLRAQSALAVLPFWLIALGCAIAVNRPPLRRPAIVLAAGLLLFAGLYGVRAYELRDPELQELMRFQSANAGPMDYAEDRLMSASDEVLAEIGWTRSELALVHQWYFMDENITAEAFETLDAALSQDETIADKAKNALHTLLAFFQANSRYCMAVTMLLAVTAIQ